jgi:hypothetical protein
LGATVFICILATRKRADISELSTVQTLALTPALPNAVDAFMNSVSSVSR